MNRLSSHSFRPSFILKAGSYQLQLGAKTALMGIVNLTPDSFSGDGLKTKSPAAVLGVIERVIRDGADAIDVGGESSRPGSKPVSVQEEIKRILPVIKMASRRIHIPISVDTYKAAVAQAALDNGAVIINTIKGATPDTALLKLVKRYDAALVLMHMQGSPKTMQKNIVYKDVVNDIIQILRSSLEKCLEIGIESDRIIIDPGIGFGKTVEHNLEILNRLQQFQTLKKPVLIGTSRKSFIGKILNCDPGDRLSGTIATACLSILKGAHILRVHDVKPVREAAAMTDAILSKGMTLHHKNL